MSDASHELRTPVALLRTRLEVADKTRDPARRDAAMRDALADSVRLSRLLDSMLELSSIEASSRAAHGATVAEAAAEGADAVERASFRAPEAEIRLIADRGALDDDHRSAGLLPEEVGRILDNLVGNALTAGGPGVRIAVDVSAGSDSLVLRVTDDAGGLPDDLGERALDRFTRGSTAPRGTGSGLGLPIVAALAQRAGGRVDLQNRPGSGLTVVVEVPIVADDDPA